MIITSDHGEEFLEHGYVEHAWTLYDESLRIPLILWINNSVRPQTIEMPVSLIDVVPTICTILDLPVELNSLDGKPFLSPHTDGFRIHNKPRMIISELLIQHRCMLRSITDDQWKYISVQKWVEPEDRHDAATVFLTDQLSEPIDPWGTIIRDELYNIKDDPHERKNLVSKEFEHAQRYRNFLERFRLERQSGNGEFWVLPETLPDDELRKLKALGYL